MGSRKPTCLIICSSNTEGVCVQSFIHAFTVSSSAFIVSIATPKGVPLDFMDSDGKNRQWISEFRAHSQALPLKLEEVDSTRYDALLIPSCPGALYDLAKHDSLMHILRDFTLKEKPICAVGFGTIALNSGFFQNNEWCFKGYSLTGPCVRKMIQRKDFKTMPVIFEDFAKDHLASYTASLLDKIHVVIDRHLITGQNSQSTLTAVQNLILVSNG